MSKISSTFILASGGSGQRFKNSKVPKQYLKVNKIPILIYSLKEINKSLLPGTFTEPLEGSKVTFGFTISCKVRIADFEGVMWSKLSSKDADML